MLGDSESDSLAGCPHGRLQCPAHRFMARDIFAASATLTQSLALHGLETNARDGQCPAVKLSFARNMSLQKGRRADGYRGDVRCWTPANTKKLWIARTAGEVAVLRTRWALRDFCCSLGRTSSCWQGTLTFKRCCTETRATSSSLWNTQEKEASCWPSPTITRTCCGLRLFGLCAALVWRNATWDHLALCCRGEMPDPTRRGEAFLSGCHRRLHFQDITLQLGVRLTGLPRLRPANLGALVEHYHRTGDALVPMLQLQDALTGINIDGLEICAPAMILAKLLEVERDSLSVMPSLTRSRLAALKSFWFSLQREGFGAQALTWVNASSQVPGTSGPLPFAGEVPKHWLNLTAASIYRSFHRIDAQVKQWTSVATLRRRVGFKVNVVMPFCARADGEYLPLLESLILQESLPLTEVVDLYIYDICYAFFDVSSSAYSLENEAEVEIDLSSGSERAGSSHSLVALSSSLLRVAKYFRRAFVIPFHEEIPTGEVSPNLHHVAQHYDDLPDFMMFIHVDVYEHVEVPALVSVLNSFALRLWPRELPFLHLGRRHSGPIDATGRVRSEIRSYCRMRAPREGVQRKTAPSIFRGDSVLERYTVRTPSGWYCQWVELAWELLFHHPPQLPEDDYGGYDYGQFVASREAAKARPKAFWQNGWRALCSSSNYRLLLGTKFLSWKDLTAMERTKEEKFTWFGFHKGLEMAFEHLWHVVFHPEAATWLWPSRLRDPSLPLGLKFAMNGDPTLLRFYRWTPHDPL
eukprot:s735_g11.t1